MRSLRRKESFISRIHSARMMSSLAAMMSAKPVDFFVVIEIVFMLSFFYCETRSIRRNSQSRRGEGCTWGGQETQVPLCPLFAVTESSSHGKTSRSAENIRYLEQRTLRVYVYKCQSRRSIQAFRYRRRIKVLTNYRNLRVALQTATAVVPYTKCEANPYKCFTVGTSEGGCERCKAGTATSSAPANSAAPKPRPESNWFLRIRLDPSSTATPYAAPIRVPNA